MLDGFALKCTQGQMVAHVVAGEGGSAAVTQSTVTAGKGAVLTRTGTGAYRITWAEESPGTFHGAIATLAAATPGNLAGHTAIFDEYDSTNRQLDFVVYNSSFAAHDLAADEHVTVVAFFAQITV
jgi:hypothetical protein